MLRVATQPVGWLLVASALTVGCGSQTPKAPHATSQSHKPAAATQFDAVYDSWVQLLGKLREVDQAYRNAEPEEQEILRPEYSRLVEEGKQVQDDLIRSAVVTYARDPAHHQDLALFLRGVVYLLANQEDYEEALRVGQLLIDNFFEDGSVYDLCGICAFNVGEFRLAEQHLKQAQESGAISQMGSGLLKQMSYYNDAWAREQGLRTAERAAGNLPRVLLKTSQGEIELELFDNEAPNTVANFLRLIEEGFYDGLEFYRVIPQSMAASGCPEGNGTGGPGYTIASECHRSDHRLHFRGSVSMVRQRARTHGSQFCLTFVPAPQLDGNQTVFGRIVRGIDVLARLQRREPRDPMSESLNPHANVVIPPADKILRATVIRKRDPSSESQTHRSAIGAPVGRLAALPQSPSHVRLALRESP